MFYELIILAFNSDIDSKTFKSMEILQADRPPRDETHFYSVSKIIAQIHFNISSNSFALTYIEKQFLY